MDQDDYFESERNPRNPGDSYWHAGEGATSSTSVPFTHTFMDQQTLPSAKKPRPEKTAEEIAAEKARRSESAKRAAKTRQDNKKRAEEAAAQESHEKWEAKQRRLNELKAEAEQNEKDWEQTPKASLRSLVPTLIEFTTREYTRFSQWNDQEKQPVYIKIYPAMLVEKPGGIVEVYNQNDFEENVVYRLHETYRIGHEPNTFYQHRDFLAPEIYIFKFDEDEDQKYVDEFRALDQKLEEAEKAVDVTTIMDVNSQIEHLMNFLLNHYKERQN